MNTVHKFYVGNERNSNTIVKIRNSKKNKSIRFNSSSDGSRYKDTYNNHDATKINNRRYMISAVGSMMMMMIFSFPVQYTLRNSRWLQYHGYWCNERTTKLAGFNLQNSRWLQRTDYMLAGFNFVVFGLTSFYLEVPVVLLYFDIDE